MDKHSVVLFVVAVLCWPIESWARTEQSTVNVYVEHERNTMIITTRSTCLVYPLMGGELQEVYSFKGRENLMMYVMRDVIGFLPERQIFHDAYWLTGSMHHWCDTRNILLLERIAATTETTSTSAHASTPKTTLSTSTHASTPKIMSTSTHASTSKTATASTMSIPTSAVTQTLPTKGSTSPTSPTSTPAGPTVLYDRTLSVKAVIVTQTECYVYRLSEIDRNLISIGTMAQAMFEQALLAKDRSISEVIDITGTIGYMGSHIQSVCTENVYLLP